MKTRLLIGFSLVVLCCTAQAQIDCREYDQHLVSSVKTDNDTAQLHYYYSAIKSTLDSNKAFPFYMMPLSLYYDVLPDTCRCFISYRPMLDRLKDTFKGNTYEAYLPNAKRIAIKTSTINVNSKYPQARAIQKVQDSLFKASDYSNWKLSDNYLVYGDNQTDSNTQIVEFKLIEGSGKNQKETVFDISLFQKFLNPNFGKSIWVPETKVSTYTTKDKKLTYVYLVGLPTEKTTIENKVVVSYCVKVVIHNDKIICIGVIPPLLMNRYAVYNYPENYLLLY